MITKNIFRFLTSIKKNNNKPWLDANRALYETSKEEFTAAIAEILKGIASFDNAFSNLTPKECMFRLNRDVRFSKEKHPYKTNYAGYFNPAGKKGDGAGYYIHIEPGKSFAAAGLWQPPAEHLSKIRQEIDYNLDEWKKIVNDKKFKQAYSNGFSMSDSLVRAPKGYEETNPAIEFLRMKNFVATRNFTDAELQDKNFVKTLVKTFQNAKPFLDFINRSLD
ncbi:MAG: DUF2461 domain-containing protein [Sphingobacteriales bacterium]|nr:MAG: DUF2461 domain-containing protein [Sphingobacteriales bacterium]